MYNKEMSDKEKINQAAREHDFNAHNSFIDGIQAYDSFMDGIQWRDANPSPKVQEELEVLQMKLAACGVAALCNTPETREENAIDRSNPYWSSSYQDVLDAVDREIALRAEVLALVETLKLIKNKAPRCNCMDASALAAEALAAWNK